MRRLAAAVPGVSQRRSDRRLHRCRRSRSAAARPQRELRARADGAAHARRRRRLHAAGRAGSRARIHGLDDRRPRQGGGVRVRPAACTTTARRSCSATASRRAAARRKASACSTSWRRTRRRRATSRPSSRSDSSPTSRPRRSSIAPRARFRETNGDLREVVRTIITSPEFFAPSAYRAKVKTPFEFVVSRRARDGRDVVNAQPLVAGAARPRACRSTGASRRPATRDRADAWVNTGALLNRMNFALSL